MEFIHSKELFLNLIINFDLSLFSNNSFDRLRLTRLKNIDWYSDCHPEPVEGAHQ